ncbi:hypothetical protein M0R45_025542 [Rubus argutus]|uniref:Uncharacterized protein n=1 Tax=Rubus argutus TaxID=59490 RepID=A0AAW1WWK0_RUBAR
MPILFHATSTHKQPNFLSSPRVYRTQILIAVKQHHHSREAKTYAPLSTIRLSHQALAPPCSVSTSSAVIIVLGHSSLILRSLQSSSAVKPSSPLTTTSLILCRALTITTAHNQLAFMPLATPRKPNPIPSTSIIPDVADPQLDAQLHSPPHLRPSQGSPFCSVVIVDLKPPSAHHFRLIHFRAQKLTTRDLAVTTMTILVSSN